MASNEFITEMSLEEIETVSGGACVDYFTKGGSMVGAFFGLAGGLFSLAGAAIGAGLGAMGGYVLGGYFGSRYCGAQQAVERSIAPIFDQMRELSR